MKLFTIPLAFLLLAGCTTMPTIVRGSSNFLQAGMVDASLKGKSFYMAIGEVNLYRHRTFGGVAPTGRTAESAVALQVDPSSGQIQKIVTLQIVAAQTSSTSTTLNTVTTIVRNNPKYILGDLVGGISVIDIHPYKSWLNALSAMRKATKDLGASGNFRVPSEQNVTTTYLSPPYLFWFEIGPHRHHHR